MNKTYFPAANTGEGFVNRFCGITPPWEECRYTYVLKGGPGVGKNTLMRNAAKRAEQKGLEVEEFHCSGDPNSLDAIRIVPLGAVILDGTAPHVIDPVCPGAKDEIVNLGCFKNQAELSSRHSEIESLFGQNGEHYRRAYAVLGAAARLRREAVRIAHELTDMAAVDKFASSLLKEEKKGRARKIFAASATPLGVFDYFDTLGISQTVTLSGAAGAAALRYVAEKAEGLEVTLLYDFICPELVRYMILPECGIAICNRSSPIGAAKSFIGSKLPDFVAALDKSTESLVASAVTELSACLKIHDRIEKLYRPYVEYEKTDIEAEKLFSALGI